MFRGSLLFSVLLNAVAVDAFIFPDLKQLRTIRAGKSDGLRIAVIQEEPYLFANGSGYVPDLMRRISESYSVVYDDSSLLYEIVPMRSWSELISSATKPSGWVSFGLVVPSLELSDWNSKQLRTSAPTIYSSVKAVSTRRGRNGESRLQLGNGRQVLVLRDSPLEYLIRGHRDLGSVQSIDAVDEALTQLRSFENSVFLTSAGMADHLAAKMPEDFQSFCTKKIPGTSPLFYAFFGRDPKAVDQMNEVIVRLMSGNALLSLYAKYFKDTRQCLV